MFYSKGKNDSSSQSSSEKRNERRRQWWFNLTNVTMATLTGCRYSILLPRNSVSTTAWLIREIIRCRVKSLNNGEVLATFYNEQTISKKKNDKSK
mmetsp:Transcript_15381/g.24924  ORF Transcript_15381/g.24924 Transcript_15381/m.24924 type:complete len:95 (+) Transcript_15381:173-457(+)